MIFVTVGAQMSFDRMVLAVDRWAHEQNRSDVFAQVGPTSQGPTHIQWAKFLNPDEFRRQVVAADIVVAHAGMGSIITALELGKPILVMPRRGSLHETRNDHQVDTAKQFLAQGKIHVAFDEVELVAKLNALSDLLAKGAAPVVSSSASPRLIEALRLFIHGQLDAAPQTSPVKDTRENEPFRRTTIVSP
jgi:UDP-N-acetylglucosamine transferase subunit ALG13